MKSKFYCLLVMIFSVLSVHSIAQTSCCRLPDSLKVLSTTDTSVCVKWHIRDSALCDSPKAYQLQVKPVTATVWRLRSGYYSGGTYFTRCDSINKCNTYQWRVRNICIKNGDTTYTVWVNGPNFSTRCDSTKRMAASINQNIKVFPNPANDKIIVQAATGSAGQVKLIIADRAGSRVYERTISVRNNKVELPVDVSRYPANMYFITITDGKTIMKTTFMKQ